MAEDPLVKTLFWVAEIQAVEEEEAIEEVSLIQILVQIYLQLLIAVLHTYLAIQAARFIHL